MDEDSSSQNRELLLMNIFEEGWGCPRCDEPVVRIIQEIGKPTQYIHARNNQSDLVHEDLTTDIKVEDNG